MSTPYVLNQGYGPGFSGQAFLPPGFMGGTQFGMPFGCPPHYGAYPWQPWRYLLGYSQQLPFGTQPAYFPSHFNNPYQVGYPQTLNQPQVAGGGSLNLSSFITEESWARELKDEFTKDYFMGIEAKLAADYARGTQVFPPKDLIFNAFNVTPLDKVKVVILGQDPYHNDGQAMGMAFSVPRGVKPPPSLKNIYKELTNDDKIQNFKTPDHGNLEAWAKRGVFLLNATLTVKAHKHHSHAKYGWQTFTDRVIQIISDHCPAVVFILWGKFAQKKLKKKIDGRSLIDEKKHDVIKTAHPSPLSYKKFENSKCFSRADEKLVAMKHGKMDWSL